MASLTKRPNGRWEIHYQDAQDKRQTIRLGKVSERVAMGCKVKIEDLITAKFFGSSIKDGTALWVMKLSDTLHSRLAKLALVESRTPKEIFEGTRLEAFLGDYIASRTDLKPRTLIKFNATKDYLIEYFKKDKTIESFTEGDAEDFRIFLQSKRGGKSEGLAENTIRKHSQITKQFFHKAVKKKIITSNPFNGLKCTVQPNPDRFFFVEEKVANKVLEACPDTQWKLIFALCRWGGLRCPSEVFALQWSDIDWDRERIKIRSPKTERHIGKASREIPLFPELKPLISKAWSEAEEGEVFVITRYRSEETNLRTMLGRYIRRAGLEPWPKLFQNLRSTRETELVQRFPVHVACRWIGNSEAIAAKHYLQLTDSHYEKAINSKRKAASENASKAIKNPQQNPQQSVSAKGGNYETGEIENLEISREVASCLPLSTLTSSDEWTRNISKSIGNLGVELEVATKSATLLADARLKRLIEYWKSLNDEDREQLLAFAADIAEK